MKKFMENIVIMVIVGILVLPLLTIITPRIEHVCTSYKDSVCIEQSSLGVSFGLDPRDYLKRVFISFSDPFGFKKEDSQPISSTLVAYDRSKRHL